MDKKKIGILGGVSMTSTIYYYQTLMNLHYEKHEDYYYPEIFIHSLDFQYFTDMENSGDRKSYKKYILESIKALENTGADFIAMAANSPHAVLHEINSETNKPILSIVDAVGRVAVERGHKELLLTGIEFTMQSNFYQLGLKKYGIDIVVPSEEHQREIDTIIFNELVLGKVEKKTKERFLKIIESYNIQGVILGCTELPLLLKNDESMCDLIDSAYIHCKEIYNFAISSF